jgi:hypothetical protein
VFEFIPGIVIWGEVSFSFQFSIFNLGDPCMSRVSRVSIGARHFLLRYLSLHCQLANDEFLVCTVFDRLHGRGFYPLETPTFVSLPGLS